MKAQEILNFGATIAGRKAIGQPMDGEQAAFLLGLLNTEIDAWQGDGMYIPFLAEIVQNVTGTGITIGTGGVINTARPKFVRDTSFFRISGVDFPIAWKSQEEFNRISAKGISGIPVIGWLEEALPLSRLNFYPAPQNHELHLRLDVQLPGFVDYDTDYDIDDGYENALKWTMAELACMGVRPVPDDVRERAVKARAMIKKNSYTHTVMHNNPFNNRARRSFSDFLTGI